jgi:histidine triad (HIT) family protein/ATP adenylyltransferase
VAFLSRYPTLLGYTIVAPRAHIVDVTGNRILFRRVVDVVHDVAEALKATLPTERIYLMSLGSHQGNAHVHWHVAPLPPGVPYERQQFHAVMAEHGVLEVTPEEQAALATRIRSALQVQIELSALRRNDHGRSR